ncbi:hypothetical protein HON71_02900 [Candidatus Woesearchaeota archaeon]|jgi:hypothetical protein|nr:hypothetical protein [Candidatus Woesearchaeota archaeon]MBT5342252.1 hypothetical protein [Candidatus Woesearchaeota archaeon]
MINEVNYEKFLLINNRQLSYKGIFKVEDIFSTINRALEEKDYTKREKKSEETVTEAGRKTYVELRPFRMITNYLTLMIKMRITFDNVTEDLVEHKSEKRIYQQGDLLIAFDGWVLSNYRNRWGMKPWFYFVKGMINKFIYKNPLEAETGGKLAQDTAYIYAKIKGLLNSYQGESGKPVKEEEIRKQVKKELKEEIKKEKNELKNN